MRVVSDLAKGSFPNGTVATIGAYDGVHLGHQTVIAGIRSLAVERGCASVVVTFDRHPASVVRPESAPKLLTDLHQKLELLAATGVDATVVVPFDTTMAARSATEFVDLVLVRCANARAVVVGEDFHFGHRRVGNVALLQELGATRGFTTTGVPLVARPDSTGSAVSSTAIRVAVTEGRVEQAARLLGRAHQVRGAVVTGDQRGRTIGFPTANVEVPNEICLPADGVYAGWYERPDGSRHAAAVNLGRRPTFYAHADHSLLEAHLIDFSADLYGEPARVSFVGRLRGEQRFEGLEAIRAQLAADVEAARAVLTGPT